MVVLAAPVLILSMKRQARSERVLDEYSRICRCFTPKVFLAEIGSPKLLELTACVKKPTEV
jgi:hypothetical protein